MNFFLIISYSETLEVSRNIEPNRTELNWIEPNRIEFNRIFSIFRCFFDFGSIEPNSKIIQMHQIHHVKSFKCNKTEFGSIEPKIWPIEIEFLNMNKPLDSMVFNAKKLLYSKFDFVRPIFLPIFDSFRFRFDTHLM